MLPTLPGGEGGGEEVGHWQRHQGGRHRRLDEPVGRPASHCEQGQGNRGRRQGRLLGHEPGDGGARQWLVRFENETEAHRRQPHQRPNQEPEDRSRAASRIPRVAQRQQQGRCRQGCDQWPFLEVRREGGTVGEAGKENEGQDDAADQLHALPDAYCGLTSESPGPSKEH